MASMFKIVPFSEWVAQLQPPPRPQVKNGRIICATCGKPADTLHLLRYDPAPKKWAHGYRVEAACPEHDPGGYWFSIDRLAKDPVGWLCHLNNKDDDRVRALLWALERSGWETIINSNE